MWAEAGKVDSGEASMLQRCDACCESPEVDSHLDVGVQRAIFLYPFLQGPTAFPFPEKAQSLGLLLEAQEGDNAWVRLYGRRRAVL